MGVVGRDAIGVVTAGALLTLVSPPAARAEMSVSDLAAKIERLEAENRQMRDDISKLRTQTRAKADKSRAAAKFDGKPDTRIDQGSDTLVRTADAPRGSELPPAKPTALGGVASPRMAAGPLNGQMRVGDITITPGGYVAAEGIFRTRALQADIATPFAAIPTPNQSFAHTNEFRYTSRQTRAAVLAEAPLTPSLTAAGYGEIDFLGAAPTANNVESNSYNPRVRVLYGTLDFADSGFHFLAGQNWTLATTNTKGILARDEALPPTIDEQFVTGFVWTRQPQLRLTKDFDRKIWVSLSAEQPQTTFGGTNCTTGAGATTIGSPAVTGVAALTCQVVPQGTGGFNSTTTPYSLNHVPDVIGKVAADPTVAGRDVHVEAYGLYRDLFDRVTYTNGVSTNQDRTGYGFGGGLVTDLVPKRLELQVSGLIGRGIGRYATSTLPDATFAPDGSVKPIPEAAFLAGLTLHATSSLDIYAFGGFERQLATYFSNGTNSFYGIGVPNTNNSGCNTELSTACSAETKQTMEITAGFWDNIYSGRYGTVKGGVQYGFATRSLFPSVFNGQFSAPKTSDNLIYTSFRFYPFFQ